MKIAGHTLGTPEYTVPEAIALYAQLGLQGIEVLCHEEYRSAIRPDISNEGLRHLRKVCDEHGLQFAAVTPYVTDLNSSDSTLATAQRDLLLRTVEMANILGAPCVRTFAGKETGGPGRLERLQRLVDAMVAPAETAAKAGIRLGFENHRNTLAESAKGAVEAVRAVNHPSIGIIYDQANLTMVGAEDYLEAIPLQAPYTIHVHVKDISLEGELLAAPKPNGEEVAPKAPGPAVPRIVGEGVLPWRQIISHLKRTGYDGWLCLQYERRWYADQLPPAEIGVKRGAQVLQEILSELG